MLGKRCRVLWLKQPLTNDIQDWKGSCCYQQRNWRKTGECNFSSDLPAVWIYVFILLGLASYLHITSRAAPSIRSWFGPGIVVVVRPKGNDESLFIECRLRRISITSYQDSPYLRPRAAWIKKLYKILSQCLKNIYQINPKGSHGIGSTMAECISVWCIFIVFRGVLEI